jgi:uncharacterized SAM-binding protein YcdF (DUF218 family)
VHLVIVLGAQNDDQGRLSPMALARARGALDVYRRQLGTGLLVTGGHGRFNPAPLPHAHYLAAHLIQQGVEADDILAQIESAHTVEDAALAHQFLRETTRSHLRSMTVVTSEVHVPRARLIFEHFFSPAQLAFVGTPDAVSPKRLQALQSHEAEQIARIRRQGGVIYQGQLLRRALSSPALVET